MGTKVKLSAHAYDQFNSIDLKFILSSMLWSRSYNANLCNGVCRSHGHSLFFHWHQAQKDKLTSENSMNSDCSTLQKVNKNWDLTPLGCMAMQISCIKKQTNLNCLVGVKRNVGRFELKKFPLWNECSLEMDHTERHSLMYRISQNLRKFN